MLKNKPKTLRLLMPQWQGGNNPAYSLGAQLLAWLAPPSNSPFVEVPVTPYTGTQLEKENGVVAQSALLKQLRAARSIIESHQPDRIVVFGGDCLVEQAPMAYLNERYNGELGVLWLDAHPDVTTPNDFQHAHAMVLGNLLGEGDEKFAAEVKVPLNPKKVMFGGLQKTLPHETEVIQRLGIRKASPQELANDSRPVLDWIKENNIKHLAIHLDLDVLSPLLFRDLLFANPASKPSDFDGIAMGEMNFPQLSRLINDVSAQTDIVGLGIAEYMPWDAINLKTLLEKFTILSDD